ncbi:MAG: Co2+/Mg2+ efflux protein ApaG [Maricaulis sp.]|jgi:ApaG protein|nr:Co2+/Mg2+ efflux protein ApaG [Maricaulis sp.]MDG2044887.1 Co2+/Mg2+ efflux protein ApaG [Maricaulis sp.]
MYECVTDGVKVRVKTDYLEDQSAPEDRRYVWAYTVEISNLTEQSVQLISRKWLITDALGHVEHVQGEGVVGDQPHIEPGGKFRYTSGAPLSTPSGFMQGSYEMRTAEGTNFAARVPDFSLDRPDDRAQLH